MISPRVHGQQNSLCIEKNQPFCHYQLKPPRAKKTVAERRRSSSSSTSSGEFAAASQLTGEAGVAVHTGGGAGTGAPTVFPGSRSVAMVPGSTPLKRLVLHSRSRVSKLLFVGPGVPEEVGVAV